MNFGPRATPEESFAIMDRALELGINFWDTANVYGQRKYEGYTETILGQYFAARPGAREKVILATKFHGRMGDGENDRGCSMVHMRHACEASLRRLQTDYIDLYQMHHVDRATPWAELWSGIQQLRLAGKIVYAGSSNFAGWHIASANEAAARHGELGLVSEQSKYSLIERTIEMEVVPACRHYGVGIIPWSPLESGLLGGVIGLQPDPNSRRSGERFEKRVEGLRPKLEAWEALCSQFGEKPADIALAWMLAKPQITAPIIGPRTLDQLNGSIRAIEIHLSTEQVQQIEAIWTGPRGEAPEAYAW